MNQAIETRLGNLRRAPRCAARTRAGTACQSPAIRDRARCRLHGGLSPGAPQGSKNGNYKNGNWTADAVAERRWLRSLVQTFGNNRDTGMTNKSNNIPTSVAGQPGRLPPVRVKMCRTGAFVEKVYPPDGEPENWWQRLNKALGTVSSDFVNASLLQIQAAARSPFGTISETAMNAALAMIAAARPKDEIEGALAVQMSCTHAAAMAILGKLDSGFGPERRIAAYASAAARLFKSVCDAS